LAIEQGWLAHDPATDVRAPKKARALPKTLTREQARTAVEAPAVEDSVEARRDRAILELLYSSGLRRAELLNLSNADFSPEVRVTGKGNKQRLVPAGRPAREAIAEWLRVRANLAGTEERRPCSQAATAPGFPRARWRIACTTGPACPPRRSVPT